MLLLLLPWLAATALAEAPLVVHEWGTLTTRHLPDGTPQGGLNRIAPSEVLPEFVHRFEPPQAQGSGRGPFGKGPAVPGHPDVTMRLETPVLYFHPPPGEAAAAPFDLEVRMRGGILNEYYPDAIPQVEVDHGRIQSKMQQGLVKDWSGEVLDNYVLGSLRWRDLRLVPAAPFPATSSRTWLAPREVASSPVLGAKGEGEQYLFYRGVAHLDALVSTRLVGDRLSLLSPPALYWIPREALELSHVWAVDIDPSQGTWFTERRRVAVPRLPGTPVLELDFAAPERSFMTKQAHFPRENPGRLRESMRLALVDQGLFPDEAEAMLATWEASWFREPGRRVFYMVPRAWIDRHLPMTLTRSHELTRVLVGRIDLIGP
jgi:hypothetical protein